MSIIFTLIWIALMVFTFVKARKLNRNPIIWVLVGLVLSPVLSSIALLVLGKHYDNFN